MYDIIKKLSLATFLNSNLSYFVCFVCVCLIYNYWLEPNTHSKDFLSGKNIHVYHVYITHYNS